MRATGQLRDPRLVRIVLLSLAAATALFLALLIGVFHLLAGVPLEGLGGLGSLLAAGGVLEILGTLGAAYVALLLFPAIAITLQSLFLDGVAEAVERRWYPGLPPARAQSFGEMLSTGLRLTLLVLAVNLLLLPLYLILLFLPPLNLMLFYAVNGWLIGREFTEIVAFRRMDPKGAAAFRRRFRGGIWLDGTLIAALFTVPVVNLAAPVVGAAFMVHRFHRRAATV